MVTIIDKTTGERACVSAATARELVKRGTHEYAYRHRMMTAK